MRPLNRSVLLAGLVGASLTASPAFAAGLVPAFDLERLHLSPAATDSLLVDTGRLLERDGLRFALTLGYERGSAQLLLDDGSKRWLVRDRVETWLTAAWSPLERLELSAQLPITAWQNAGGDPAAPGVPLPPHAGLGTPQVGARVALLRREAGAKVSLSAGLDVSLPGGAADALNRQAQWSGFQLLPRIAAGGLAGPLVLGASVGARVRSKEDEPGSPAGSEFELGATAATQGNGLRGELSLELAQSLVGGGTAAELLAGARLPLPGGFEAYAIAGRGFTHVAGSPSWRGLLGLAWAQRPAPTPPVAAAPPPPPPPVDVCASGGPHRPEQCPDLDDDQDGVLNRDDRCPTVKGPASNHGCPVPDTDGDGLADDVDNCPKEPGPASNQGCPEQKPQLVKIENDRLKATTQLSFEDNRVLFPVGQATLGGEGTRLLRQIAEILKVHPEITRLRIEGHTDNTGPADLNRRLSQARADAVRSYLIGQGVEPGRLESRGYGPDRPKASNDTAEGRQANRRSEFIIVGRDERVGAPK